MAWEYLFDSDYRQRDDINRALAEADTAHATMSSLTRRVGEAEARVAKLELTVEALIRIMDHQKTLSRNDVALMIQRLDLADGVEDGVMGPDRSREAPKCDRCGRPVNPRRESCIYCNATVAQQTEKPPRRETTCTACGKIVPEVDTYITERGAVCSPCYRTLG